MVGGVSSGWAYLVVAGEGDADLGAGKEVLVRDEVVHPLQVRYLEEEHHRRGGERRVEGGREGGR